MSTSPISFRRHARRGALALVVGALMVPASPALAQGDSPADHPGVTGSPQISSPIGDTPADYPGMPGSPQAPPPVASHAPEASGFDWTSAGIGAGGAGVLLVVVLGGAAAASRLRFGGVRS